jgi:hypothetical protein
MILRTLIAAAMLLAAAPAAATDWAYAVINRSSPAGAVYVDLDRVERAGGGRMKVWLLYVFPQDNERGLAALITQRDLDCTNRRGQRLRIGSFRADGSVLDTDGPVDTEWRDVVAGSFDTKIFDFVCGDQLRASGLQRFGAAAGPAIRHGRGLFAN